MARGNTSKQGSNSMSNKSKHRQASGQGSKAGGDHRQSTQDMDQQSSNLSE